MKLFYTSVIESVILYNSVVWFKNLRKEDMHKLQKIANQASKIFGGKIDLTEVCGLCGKQGKWYTTK